MALTIDAAASARIHSEHAGERTRMKRKYRDRARLINTTHSEAITKYEERISALQDRLDKRLAKMDQNMEHIAEMMPPAYALQGDAEVLRKGSKTRAAAWGEELGHPNNKMNVDMPWERSSQLVIDATRAQFEERVVAELNALASPDERKLNYASVTATLNEYFSTLAHTQLGALYAVDTHAKHCLGPLSPDVCLQRNTHFPDRFNIAAVLELKATGIPLESHQHLGQLLDYFLALKHYQSGRHIFLGLLTDLDGAIVVKYTTDIAKGRFRRVSASYNYEFTTKITQYNKVLLSHALRFLAQQLADPAGNPPTLSFTPEAGELQHLVCRHSTSLVGKFLRQGTFIIVKARSLHPTKHYNSIATEIRALLHLNRPGMPPSIPSLVYYDLAAPEFGIAPVGTPFVLDSFKDSGDFRQCLLDVLEGITWVHESGLVHRDIRIDNVLVYTQHHSPPTTPTREKRGMLIDFDKATAIGVPCEYEGGYICCPLELLRAQITPPESPSSSAPTTNTISNTIKLYTPQKKHDYLAFVLLVNTLLFPYTMQSYSYAAITEPNSQEQRRLFMLWEGLRGADPWKGMVALAEEEVADVTQWREVLGGIVWL